MDHAPRTMLEMSAACLVFLMAVASGLMLFQGGDALHDLAYRSLQAQDRSLLETNMPLARDGTLSGAEVFQSIARLETGDADLVVDGIRYTPTSSREQLQPVGIPMQGRYQAVNERNADGQLLRVNVRSLP